MSGFLKQYPRVEPPGPHHPTRAGQRLGISETAGASVPKIHTVRKRHAADFVCSIVLLYGVCAREQSCEYIV